MEEYIRRDKLLEARKHAIHVYENANILNTEGIRTALKPLLDAIVDIPATDVKEVIHAEWEYFGGITPQWRCSHCHSTYGMEHKTNYCPKCGAKMDKK